MYIPMFRGKAFDLALAGQYPTNLRNDRVHASIEFLAVGETAGSVDASTLAFPISIVGVSSRWTVKTVRPDRDDLATDLEAYARNIAALYGDTLTLHDVFITDGVLDASPLYREPSERQPRYSWPGPGFGRDVLMPHGPARQGSTRFGTLPGSDRRGNPDPKLREFLQAALPSKLIESFSRTHAIEERSLVQYIVDNLIDLQQQRRSFAETRANIRSLGFNLNDAEHAIQWSIDAHKAYTEMGDLSQPNCNLSKIEWTPYKS